MTTKEKQVNAGLSCKTCPSFLKDDEAVRLRFGKPIGASMCARFGYVLGRPDIDNDEVTKMYAMDCESYGETVTEVPVSITPKVSTLDEKIMSAGATGETVPTCAGCTNLVSSATVADEMGWAAPLCKAKGMLILKPLIECRGCPWASPGKPSNDLLGVEVRAEYKPGYFVPTEVAVKAFVSMGNTAIEPSEYTSDKDVSSEDKTDGIRAWRKVQDPHGSGNVVYLPIFDPSKFNTEELALIPRTGDPEHPELYVDYSGLLYTFTVESFILDETLVLQGPPGVGKTEFARWVAYLMQVPFRRFSFSGSTEVEDMIGKWVFVDGQTVFHEGRIPQAWVRTGVLVFDEPNTAPEDVSQVIRPLIDNSKQLVLDAARGESRVRDDYCFFLMAMNPSWDPRNTGTRELAGADGSRLSVVSVGMPPESVERHIIKQRCALDGYDISDETLSQIMAIARDIREYSDQGTFPGTWGVREQIKVARKTRWYKLIDAYKRASLDLYEPDTAELIVRAISSLTGEDEPVPEYEVPF
jgi:MoxR-like ATPase